MPYPSPASPLSLPLLTLALPLRTLALPLLTLEPHRGVVKITSCWHVKFYTMLFGGLCWNKDKEITPHNEEAPTCQTKSESKQQRWTIDQMPNSIQNVTKWGECMRHLYMYAAWRRKARRRSRRDRYPPKQHLWISHPTAISKFQQWEVWGYGGVWGVRWGMAGYEGV